MKARDVRRFVFAAIVLGCEEGGAQSPGNKAAAYEDPAIMISWIAQVGPDKVLDDLLGSANESNLSKVLAGIRSGNDQWLTVLSRLRPPLMASREALQFDSAMGEALDKNLAGVLRNAAEIEKRQTLYIFFVCGSYSDQWNEEISTKERASRAVPQLKNRQKAVTDLKSSEVPAEVKASCLDGIANALNFFD